MAIRSTLYRWDIGPIAERCEMFQPDFGDAVLAFALLVFVFHEDIFSFFKWLKGYPTTYYITESGGVHSSPETMRESNRWDPDVCRVLEISRGLFRRSSRFYSRPGMGPENWTVGHSWLSVHGASHQLHLRGECLMDSRDALRFVNRFTSLGDFIFKHEEMLKRIDELEQKLRVAEDRCHNLRIYGTSWRSSVAELKEGMDKPQDRRRFKGADSREISNKLGVLILLMQKRESRAGL